MKVQALIQEFRDLPLRWSTGEVNLPPQHRPVDWSSGGKKAHFLLRIDQPIEQAHEVLLDNIYFSGKAHYLGDVVQMESFAVSSAKGGRYMNVKFVKLSTQSCAMLGEVSSRAAQIAN